jgi:hypothetical protein
MSYSRLTPSCALQASPRPCEGFEKTENSLLSAAETSSGDWAP